MSSKIGILIFALYLARSFSIIMSSLNNNGDTAYILNQVLNNTKLLIGKQDDMQKSMDAIKEEVASIKSKVFANTSRITDMNNELGLSKEDILRLKESFRDMEKRFNEFERNDAMYKLRKATDERVCNVVVHGLQHNEDRKEADQVRNLFREMEIPEAEIRDYGIRYTTKFKNEGENTTTGPIIVTLRQPWQVFQVFAYARTANMSDRVSRDLPFPIRAAPAMLQARVKDLKLITDEVKVEWPAKLVYKQETIFEFFKGFVKRPEEGAMKEIRSVDFKNIDQKINALLASNGKKTAQKSARWEDRKRRLLDDNTHGSPNPSGIEGLDDDITQANIANIIDQPLDCSAIVPELRPSTPGTEPMHSTPQVSRSRSATNRSRPSRDANTPTCTGQLLESFVGGNLSALHADDTQPTTDCLTVKPNEFDFSMSLRDSQLADPNTVPFTKHKAVNNKNALASTLQGRERLRIKITQDNVRRMPTRSTSSQRPIQHRRQNSLERKAASRSASVDRRRCQKARKNIRAHSRVYPNT